ncbi:hypothetical protein BX666DRAFT_1907472 [Dichotomocladium elegans]|nr:hypothetical protein BX666DRAFT_1907472 [Dichotomocladium elegans]
MTLAENEYYVQRVAGRKYMNKKTYYLLEWDGYEPKFNTWEEEKNLLGNTSLVTEFEKNLCKQYPGNTNILRSRGKLVLSDAFDPEAAQPAPGKANRSALSKKRKASGSFDNLENMPQQLIDNWPMITEGVSKKMVSRFLSNLNNSITKSKSSAHVLSRDRNNNQYFKGVIPYVSVVNDVDDEPFPTSFNYITSYVYSEAVSPPDPAFLTRCECSSRNCGSCHDAGPAYSKDGTLIVERGTPIYECNSSCVCDIYCNNRTVQQGRNVPLQIFKTKGKGWGVRAMDDIQRGQFVEEYIGEVITEEEGEFRGSFYDKAGMTYLFDMDFGVSDDTPVQYVIDSFLLGNASHFFNHSCTPNLHVYAVYYDSGNPYFHRLAFFANRKIKKGEELTIDYQGGGSLNSEDPAPHGKFACRCGSPNCRKWIHK